MDVSEQTFTISRVYFNRDEQDLLSIEGLLHSICDGHFRLSRGGIARMSLKENRLVEERDKSILGRGSSSWSGSMSCVGLAHLKNFTLFWRPNMK